MKIQPYNKNFSGKREERRNQGVKPLETNSEQRNETKKWKKKNTGCKTVNKYTNLNTVQFKGTNKVLNSEQIYSTENKMQVNGTICKTLRCNLTAQLKRENSKRGISTTTPK